MLVLGVDPGKQGAASAWIDDRFQWVRSVDNTKEAVLGVLQWAQRESPACGGLSIAIERQFQARGGHFNPSTTETLMRSRFLWEILAEVLGIDTTLVWPATWQSKQLAPAPKTSEDGKKMGTKARSIWVANRYVQERDWTDGEADAALIGRWYSRLKIMEKF